MPLTVKADAFRNVEPLPRPRVYRREPDDMIVIVARNREGKPHCVEFPTEYAHRITQQIADLA